MKTKGFIALLCFLAAMLAGCEFNKQTVGTVGGGAVGGLVGSRFGGGSGQLVATAAGTLIGAMIGGSVGKSMDDTDRKQVKMALESNKTGKARRWKNPDNGASYKVVPTRTYQRKVEDGSTRPCREYTTTAIIGGVEQKIYGTACRMDDGSWKIVSQK